MGTGIMWSAGVYEWSLSPGVCFFELNFRDERYLPFEGAGAISCWSIGLPDKFRQFDYGTISDVILHIHYTARQGVDPDKVAETMDGLLNDSSRCNLALLFSLRHDFPTEWSAFLDKPGAGFTATIRKAYFPYFTQDTRSRKIKITGVSVAGPDPSMPPQAVNVADATDVNSKNQFDVSVPAGLITPNATGTPDATADVFLLINYTLASV